MGGRRVVVATIWIAALLAAAVGCSNSTPDTSTGTDTETAPAPRSGTAAERRARRIFERIGPSDPFCTAAVLRGDEIVFAEAFGSNDGELMTVDDEVDIASVSKQFTGVAIELLIERGELSGSDLVGELVPASLPATDDITVDELLTHTSGLADYTDLLPEEFDERTTQAEAIAAIAESEPTGSRGTFEYSNSNYVLLAEVVESVSGTPLPEFLDAEVFEPLDLDMALDPRGPWLQVGDGSIWTTPTELVTWSAEYWDQTLDGPDLASVMFDPEVDASEGDEDSDATYGSGILRGTLDDGTATFFHDGSWDDYETDWALIPDEHLAAAITCNADAKLTSDEPAQDLLDLWR